MEFDNHTIRLIAKEDLADFYILISENRPRLEAFFAGTVSKTRTFENTKNYFSEILKKADEKTYLPFVIVSGDGKLIGFIDVKNIDWNIPKGELGCFIDKGHEGKGIAKAAFSILTGHLFTDLGFNKLFLRTHESNKPARALAESCGFEAEGILRRDYKTTTGELVDLIYYGMVKD